MKIIYKNHENYDVNGYKYNHQNEKGIIIVYEFTINSEEKEIVLGKYNGNAPYELSGITYVQWLVSVLNLINEDKLSSSVKKYYYNQFINNKFTKLIEFTKEGYDLITNKYKYLDDELLLSVTINKPIKLRIANINKLDKQCFYKYDYLDKYYFFNKEEINKIDDKKLIDYIKSNLKKVNNYIKENNDLYESFIKCKTSYEKIDLLKKYLYNDETFNVRIKHQNISKAK